MNIGSLNYLTKEGFRNVWVNRLMSIASISVLSSCLVMIGIASLLLANIGTLLDSVDEQNIIVAFIDDNATESDIRNLGSQIYDISNVETANYISREEGMKEVLADLENDSLRDYIEGDASFVPASYEIVLKDMSKFEETLGLIKTLPGITNIRENRELAESLVHIRSSASYISLGVVVLLLIVSFFIIFNTIRITMLNRKLEINIMRSVGATKFFIRWPFMVEGMLLGLFSSGVSLLFVYGIYSLIGGSIGNIPIASNTLSLQPFGNYVLELIIMFLVIGVLTGVVGSVLSTKRYLKEKVYDVISDEEM